MSERANQWLSPQEGPTAGPQSPSPAVEFAPPPVPASAVHRQPGSVPPPSAPLGSLPWPSQTTVRWWALGVHGGAGTTTVLQALSGGADAVRRWPDVQGALRDVHVLLVARTDARGLDAARSALQEWSGGMAPASTNVAGLVLMADAPGRLPGPLRDRVRLLSGVVSRIWEVPWIPELRERRVPKRPVRELQQLSEFVRTLTLPTSAPVLPAPPAAHPSYPEALRPVPPMPQPPGPWQPWQSNLNEGNR
jgi:hypothetical protein